LIAEGDKVVALGRFSGIHQGDVETPFGIRPGTGKQVIVKTITVFRIADGKLAEQWGMGDDMGFFRQVGALPTANQGSNEPSS
jgi:predicted ester cyclase